jgi:hypothetical protein
LVSVWVLEVNFLEQKKNIPAPEVTAQGKYKCRADNQEYDTREDYEAHCQEEHPAEM